MPPLAIELLCNILEGTCHYASYSLAVNLRKVLSVCSRVCRAWREPSQSLLYRRVIPWTDQKYEKFRDFLAATPHIAPHIHEFNFWTGHVDQHPDDSDYTYVVRLLKPPSHPCPPPRDPPIHAKHRISRP